MRILVALGFVAFSSLIATAAEPAKDLLSRYVPSDVLGAIAQLPQEQRNRLCTARLDDRRQLARLEPQPELKGLSSQMMSTMNVSENIDTLSTLTSALMAAAYLRDNDADKTFLLAVLDKWAAAKAYEKTYDCSDLNRKACTEWTSQRGTELSSLKDYQTAEDRIISLAFAYNVVLRDFRRDELADEHKRIEEWFAFFQKRLPDTGRAIKSKIFLGFGFNWQTYGYPLRDLLKGDEKSFKSRLNNLLAKLDPMIAKDGSFPARTERGARALIYHQSALAEMMLGLEMAKANGVDVYDKYKDRLEKAVTIFLDGVEDVNSGRNTVDNPARIYQWAKADYHSAADPRVQIWQAGEGNAVSQYGSWIFSFMYRFPDSPVTARLRALVASYDHLPESDMGFGLNLGCFYRAAIPDLAEREVAHSPDISDKQVASLTDDVHGVVRPEEPLVPVGYARASFVSSGSWETGEGYNVSVINAKVGDAPAETLQFGILTDFNGAGRDPSDLGLFRMTIDKSALKDPATDLSKLVGCDVIAVGEDNVRLHYGRESADNACVLDAMGPQDRLKWYSLFKALPDMLKAEGKSPAAAALEPLLAVKLAEKSG